MSSPPSPLSQSFQQSLLQKQQEITQLNIYKFKTLENLLSEKEEELSDAQKRYKQLRDDFEYNLKLLEGRDEELKRYDKTFLQLKRDIHEREKISSELKSQIKDSEEKFKREQQRANDLEIYYQEQLQALKQDFDSREAAQKKKAQKQEQDYENLIKQIRQQHEERIQDETLKHQDQLHEKDLHLQQHQSTIQHLETQVQDLQGSQKSLDNEKANMKHEMETKISLLNDQIASLQDTIESLKANHQKQLDSIKNVNVQHTEEINKTYEQRLTTLKTQLAEAQSDTQRLQSKVKQTQYESEDKLKQLQSEYDELKKQMEESLSLKDVKIEEVNNRIWETELSHKNYEEKYKTAQKNLNERKQDIEYLKRELAKASERENQLKRNLLQDQFKIEQDLENREREISKKNDDLIKATQRDRDEALSQLSLKNQQIENLQKQLKEAREKQQFSRPPHPSSSVRSSGDRKNQNIVDAIDDELGLGSLRAPSPLQSLNADDVDTTDYVHGGAGNRGSNDSLLHTEEHNYQNYLSQDKSKAHLARENEELRKRNSELHEQNMQIREGLEEMKREIESSTHVQQNSDQIRHLHQELDSLHSELNRANAKIVQKQDHIDQLEKKLHEQEEKIQNSGSAHKMEEMLEQLKREFERKNHSHMESSEQVTNLNSQLTELRVDYERQKDKYIRVFEIAQKLKKENKHLRSKLKSAVKDMKRVLSDREKLIDINNMYKAELKNVAPKGHIKKPSVFTEGASSPVAVESKGHYEDVIRRQRNEITKLEAANRRIASDNQNLRRFLPEEMLAGTGDEAPEHELQSSLELEGNTVNMQDRPRTAGATDRETKSQRRRNHRGRR